MGRVVRMSSAAAVLGFACASWAAGCSSSNGSESNGSQHNPDSDGSAANHDGQSSSGDSGSNTSGTRKINLSATGVPVSPTLGTQSVDNPTPQEYEGMGVHSGESVVLGLKIKLTGISLTENPPGQPSGHGGPIFNWSSSPKELSIEAGFSGTIEDSAPLTFPNGSYSVVQVSYLSQYELKAYAYLDTDKDGEIDTTIYTTPTGVKSVASEKATADLTDLGYTSYGFTYSYNADSVTHATTVSGDITMMPAPVTIGSATDAGESSDASPVADGSDATDGGSSSDVSITLFIDSYRVVKVWDGQASGPGDHVDVIFPQGPGEGRTNQYGVHLTDLYPLGSPTFGLQYIPTFAFANASNYTSETYLIAPSLPFTVSNAQAMSMIFDGSGTPIIGRTQGNPDQASPQLGQAARMFEPMGTTDAGATTYRYFVEYGTRDGSGVDDGGMYYHNDKTMAGHIVEGFQRLEHVGDTSTIAIKDGPRCHAEYDYCFGDRTAVIRRVR